MSEPTKAVFLSYAREDTDAAKRIAEALRGFGVEVWFDQAELHGGDAWDQKIRRQIRECALFVPIVSQQTEERAEGYFRREWKIAIDRTQDMGSSRAFIVPVVIDGTKETGADVPEEFMRYQWTRLSGGTPTPEFVALVKRLLEAPRKPAAQKAEDRGQKTEVSQVPKKPAVPVWLWGASAVIALGVAAFFALRKPEPLAAPVKASSAPASGLLATHSSLPATASDKSIAVLAFADLSEARNSEYFSDGISEELLNVLAKVPGLRVAARTSAFYFKGKNLPIPEIAQKLNVAYVVEGSVQRAGERVKITAQLIKAADGYHVWSDTFTRDAKDVFAVQEEIAGLIAKQLSLKLGATSAAATAAVNPQAFEFYLQGRQAWNLRTAEGYTRAEDLLNRALALDPNFARAHAALATVWSVRGSSDGLISAFGQRTSPAVARIQAQIDRALALEPDLAEAHTAQGSLFWNTWRIADAVRSLHRAIELNPSDASAHQFLGRVLLADGRLEEAAAALKRATELDPLSHRILDNYAIVLRDMGRPAEALAFDERALALQPESVQATCWKALDLSALGRHAEAVAQIRRLPVDDTSYSSVAVEVFAAAGMKEDAERELARTEPRDRYQALAALGRLEEALAAMEPATISIQGVGSIYTWRAFDPIRGDPRFVKLLATLGLTEAHARAQAWRAAQPAAKPEAKK